MRHQIIKISFSDLKAGVAFLHGRASVFARAAAEFTELFNQQLTKSGNICVFKVMDDLLVLFNFQQQAVYQLFQPGARAQLLVQPVFGFWSVTTACQQ